MKPTERKLMNQHQVFRKSKKWRVFSCPLLVAMFRYKFLLLAARINIHGQTLPPCMQSQASWPCVTPVEKYSQPLASSELLIYNNESWSLIVSVRLLIKAVSARLSVIHQEFVLVGSIKKYINKNSCLNFNVCSQ